MYLQLLLQNPRHRCKSFRTGQESPASDQNLDWQSQYTYF